MSSSPDEPPASLTELIDRLCEIDAGEGRTQVADLLEAVGSRSFGPVLLVAGLLAVSPISGIPGLPSLVGLLVTLIAAQLLVGRRTFWLPDWLLRRSVPSRKLGPALRWMRGPARRVDALVRPRLVELTDGPVLYAVAVLCIGIAAMMPPLELVPFSATIAGSALATFGLSLIARDGLLVLLAVGLTAAGGGILYLGVF